MSSRALSLLLLTALALTACRERALNVLSTDLSVPEALDFGVVYVGFTRAQSLELSNRGRAPMEFRVTAPAPFSAPQSVRVPGGTAIELELQLTGCLHGGARSGAHAPLALHPARGHELDARGGGHARQHLRLARHQRGLRAGRGAAAV